MPQLRSTPEESTTLAKQFARLASIHARDEEIVDMSIIRQLEREYSTSVTLEFAGEVTRADRPRLIVWVGRFLGHALEELCGRDESPDGIHVIIRRVDESSECGDVATVVEHDVAGSKSGFRRL